MRILLVEDDPMIGKTLQQALQQDGYAVDWMRALLRRDIARKANLLRHRELALDPVTHTATQSGRPVELSAREFALLAALLERPGAALSKAQLEERLYPWGDEVESNAIEVH